MKYIIGLLATLLPILSGAQSPPIKPLTIGDTVPDIVFNHVTNYKISTAKLSDFKGDLILLDFWGTWCTGCIQSFPKMDSLKKKFDLLQVLLVNTKSKISGDNEQIVQNTLKKIEQRTGCNIGLPVVFASDEVDQLFPLKYVPHIVWLSQNKIIAITGAEEVTSENISAVLNGSGLNVHIKKDLQSYDTKRPLFENGNGGEPREILFRSMLTAYIEGLGQEMGYRIGNDKIVGVFLINTPLLNILKNAFRDSIRYSDNRIIIQSTKAGILSKDNKRHHSFCYELIVPPVTEQQIILYMQADLKKYFGIRVYNEKHNMKCLVLHKSSATRTPHKKILDKSSDLQKDTRKKYIHNRSVAFSVRVLNEYSTLPIIDESGIQEDISIDLPFDLTDIKALQNAFSKAGFNLKEEKREIEVTVIADL